MPRRVYTFDGPDRFVAGTIGEPGRPDVLPPGPQGRRRRQRRPREDPGGRPRPAARRAARHPGRPRHRERPGRGRPGHGRRRSARRAARRGVPGRRDGPRLGRRATTAWSSRRPPSRRTASRRRTTPSEDPDGPDLVRIRIDGPTARAFVERATRVVAAGPAALPALRRAARPAGPHLRSTERLPELGVDALRLLREGELEVRGRLTVSSNAALVGIVGLPTPDGEAAVRLGAPGGLLEQLLGDEADPSRPEPGRGRLQADRVRAAAVGLPRRDAGPPRGRRLPGLRGDRLGDRPADRPARRSGRPGDGPAVARRGRRDRRLGAGRDGRPAAPADGPARRGRSTTPTGRAATSCRSATDERRPPVRRRPRRLLLGRPEAADGPLGVAREADRARRARRPRPLRAALDGGLGTALARAPRPGRGRRRPAPGSTRCSTAAGSPSRRPTGRPCPGRRIDGYERIAEPWYAGGLFRSPASVGGWAPRRGVRTCRSGSRPIRPKGSVGGSATVTPGWAT